MPSFGKKKKKRQPSFTMPKNPHKHRYGSTSSDQHKGPMVGTWTLMKTRKKEAGAVAPVEHRGLMNLNSKVSAGLNPSEISTWIRDQKVGLSSLFFKRNFLFFVCYVYINYA